MVYCNATKSGGMHAAPLIIDNIHPYQIDFKEIKQTNSTDKDVLAMNTGVKATHRNVKQFQVNFVIGITWQVTVIFYIRKRTPYTINLQQWLANRGC